MKRHLNLLNTVLFFTLLSAIPAASFARNGGDDVEKKKTISKSYPVTASDKLKIENSFGDVVINTWDKNEIKVDIEMGANSSSDERAQKILDGIEVKDSRSGNTISFKTDVNINEHRDKKENKENNKTFHIDYVIYMPTANALEIENQFGKITVPDFGGLANLTSKFGGLTTGKLDNVETIDVEFGTAQIGQVNNGKVTFKFDSKSHIGKVGGSVKINSEFSNNVQFNIENSIQDLSVNESYSTIKMIATKELSANFDIHTSFGHFRNNTDFKISEDKDDNENSGPRFDKDYSGKAGGGSARIKIKSSFGSVRLSHSEDSGDDDREERQDRKDKKEKRKEVKEKEEVSL